MKKLLRAILKYQNGVTRIKLVDSESQPDGTIYVTDRFWTDDRLFQYDCDHGKYLVYKEIEQEELSEEA